MSKTIEIIADFDIYIRGIGQVGTAHKVTVPKLTQIKESHSSGAGDYEVSIGQFEKLEASFTVLREEIHFYKEIAQLNEGEIDFVEAVKEGAKAREGLYEFRGIIDIEGGDSERKKKKEVTVKISCNKAYHSIDNEEAYYIDHRNNICRVGGVDHNEKVRQIIGG